jgi:membrane protease YdiL (CAAX protease family)
VKSDASREEAPVALIKLPAGTHSCNEVKRLEENLEKTPAEEVPPGGASGEGFLPMALAFYGVLLLAAVCWSRWTGTSLFYLTAEADRSTDALVLNAFTGLLVAAAVIGLSEAITRWTTWGDRMSQELARLIGRCSIRDCIVLGLASGIAEEAFFRGAMQPRLGLLGTSLIFGLVHFAPKRELLPWTGFALAAGFLLGGLYVATGSLIAPVVAHVVINAVNLRQLGVRYG